MSPHPQSAPMGQNLAWRSRCVA